MDNAVALAQTYLRLNGFFTVTEFQVQRAVAGRPGTYETATDLDILAVRFPWAAEAVAAASARHGDAEAEVILAQDPLLDLSAEKMELVIGEVKEGVGELNRRLRTPEVLSSAVWRAGCCPEEHRGMMVSGLATRGEVELDSSAGIPCRVRLASFCGVPSSDPGPPGMLVVTLAHIIAFVRDRLETYAPVLRSAAFRDPVLGLMKLFDKLGIELQMPAGP